MNDDKKKPQTHLLYSDRFYIEQALNGNDSITEIATFLNRDISTISKEIKRAIGFRSEHYIAADAQCLATHCRPVHLCGDRTCSTNCRRCPVYDCKDLCGHYETSHCKRLDRPPYVCNPCPSKQACHISKHYYRAADAQRMYEKKLSESRKGINLTPEELKQLNDTVSPLIKKGQPLSHIFAVHSEDIPCAQRTLYNYIDQGLLDARNLDLPRRVRFKKRRTNKSSRNSQKDQLYRLRRTYKDFEKYTEAFPDLEVVELDTVKGSRDRGKCLMTLLFRRSNFMLIFLLNQCTQECVIHCFNELYGLLGHRLFRRSFPIILTDNGPEFKDPWSIEKAPDGKTRTKVFYCDPYVSNQKGKLEKNHEFIRYVIPKGRSMYFLTPEKVRILTNHVNSVARESLNGATPFDLAELLLDKRIPVSLGLRKVSPDNVLLKPALLK